MSDTFIELVSQLYDYTYKLCSYTGWGISF
jgi:hypothetical protein